MAQKNKNAVVVWQMERCILVKTAFGKHKPLRANRFDFSTYGC